MVLAAALTVRDWIRGQPCVVPRCGQPGDPHHVKSRGAGGRDVRNLVPCCRVHHTEGGTIGWTTFERKYGLDLRTLAETYWRRYLRFIRAEPVDEAIATEV